MQPIYLILVTMVASLVYWFVVAAAESDPFTREPASLWRDVLRRQGGQLAMFAYFPAEPGLN